MRTHSLEGRKREVQVGERAWKHGMPQTRTHQLEGGKREEQVGQLRNVAHHKRGLTTWGGERGGRGKSKKIGGSTNNEEKTGGEEEGGGGGGGYKKGRSQIRTHRLRVKE